MNISIFGLGYVGCVSAACLAEQGHRVIGVDINPTKVDIINAGKSPIVEPGLAEILASVVSVDHPAGGSLIATTDAKRAVLDTDISLICVGTPSNHNGSLMLDYVRRCARSIGEGLKQKNNYHVVVARSTMLPGSVEDAVSKEVEYASGKREGREFATAMNPEFLRESTSIKDFYAPPMTVIGADDDRAGDILESLYEFLDAPVVRSSVRATEMVKYACNSFHALKVAFANEIGALCKPLDIDSHEVMKIFCMDHKLNISDHYLKPGFAFGGSCLPKDLRAIGYKARSMDLDTPLLQSVMDSNRAHIERVTEHIMRHGKKHIGLLGLSFKAETDDLRESPIVTLAETLIGKGFNLLIYDSNVAVAKLFGANKDYIENEIPHISSLMCETLDDVITNSEVLVIGNKSVEFEPVIHSAPADKIVYDLVRMSAQLDALSPGYQGVAW